MCTDDPTTPDLTKRERFAAMAMQGLLANSDEQTCNLATGTMARAAVEYADELIKVLESKVPS